MPDYIERESAVSALEKALYTYEDETEKKFKEDPELDLAEWFFHRIFVQVMNGHDRQAILDLPAADVVKEENILKFYYVRSIDEYWIGQRIDNFYYAEYDFNIHQWVWTYSRYLPWGEHVVSPTSLWKEHTYPSKPEEIHFAEWLQGFFKKHAADLRPVVLCRDCKQYCGRPWENNETGICARTDCGVGEDDFCSYGEKQEES